ncbi:MAG: carboxypeptidase regulatory-like domain-containing protein [Lentisphaerae bacterium]|nr:carboxypeptidase regulatory-like domain-containing protein [Lentisphaerota bacterium]
MVPGAYSITGTIAGDIIEGVTIALSGDASETTTTDNNGNYKFVNLANGSYTVTPSLSGYDFEPASIPVTIAGADQSVSGFISIGGDVAVGMKFVIEAADVKGLPAPKKFTAKPKVYTKYDTATKTGLVSNATVLTKVDKATGTTYVDCEWIRTIRLFDVMAFKAAEKQGISAGVWANNTTNQRALEMNLCIESSQFWEESLRTIALPVPVISDISSGGKDAKGNTLLVITGRWFGTNAPKVWREYTDSYNKIQHQTVTLVKPTAADGTEGYLNIKGKPAYMSAETGLSKVVIIVPAKAPKGTLNGTIVLDNGAGMATGTQP